MPILNTLSSASKRSYGMMGDSESIDPYFSSVHLLLHLDQSGTSVKNETVLDSSIYAAPIVRPFSNTSQSSFTPYSNGYSTGSWSHMFVGTTNAAFANAVYTSNAVFQFGAGNFTVEFWISTFNYSSLVDSLFRSIVDFRTTDTLSTQFAIGYNSAGQLLSYGMPGGTSSTVVGQLPLGAWSHVAVVRNGANFVFYVNGVMSSTVTAGTSNYTEQGLRVGSSTVNTTLNGVQFYISNLRVTKGQVLYTGTFSPSTIPITISTNGNASGNVVQPVSTNVSFLGFQNYISKDNSLNAISPAGTAPIFKGAGCQFNPFPPLEAYSPKRHGGSYFGGPLTVSANSIYVLGTSNFTIEFWACQPFESLTPVFAFESGSTALTISITGTSNLFQLTVVIPGGTTLSVAAGSKLSWNHFAVVRNGTTFSVYVNGKLAGSTTSTSFFTGTQPTISSTTSPATIADFRIVNGTAVYTSDFDVPTSPLQAISNTVLLLSFANGCIYDAARMAMFYFGSLSFPGVDTENEIFGNASLKSIAATSRFSSAQTLANANGSLSKKVNGSFPAIGAQFTVEMWIFKTSTPAQLQLLLGGTDASRFYLGINTSNQIYVAYGNPVILELTTTLTVPNSQWTHIAVTRDAGYLTRVWVNGQLGASGTQASSFNIPSWLSELIISDSFVGNIDEIRISGISRYSQTFTPSGPFPNK